MMGIALVWLPPQIERFKTLWYAGVSLRLVAQELKCGETSVRKIVKDLKLAPRPPVVCRKKTMTQKRESEYWVVDRKQRTCLGCQTKFESKGRHTFVCDECKSRKAWKSGGDFEVRV
jgi:hypothetical protein